MNDQIKEWWEEWQVTHNVEGADVWTLSLPNNKPWAFKLRADKTMPNYNDLVTLISYMEKSLMEIGNLKNPSTDELPTT